MIVYVGLEVGLHGLALDGPVDEALRAVEDRVRAILATEFPPEVESDLDVDVLEYATEDGMQ